MIAAIRIAGIAGLLAWLSPIQPAMAGGPPGPASPLSTGGDKAAYAAWNANGERWIYGVELRDADTGRLLTSASRSAPWAAGSLGWRGYGAAYLPDNGVPIPERVSIGWWFDEAAAGQRDPALRQGPYIVALRSRLGERALEAAIRGERGFLLEIGIGGGVVPPILRWHLSGRDSRGFGGFVVERGGDEVNWRPTSWR